MRLCGTRRIGAAVVSVAIAGATAPVTSAQAADVVRSFEIYGFAQADYIQDFNRVQSDWEDALRPSKISVEDQYGANGQASLSVKQSRFGVKGVMPTGENTAPIDFKFEFDLFGVGSNAGQTTFRLRHAYGEWGSLLAGQTNSVFMDIDVFPNVIDYWGPAGMVFYRNVQIRWTPYRTDTSQFAVALERPGNDVDSGNVRLVQGFEGTEIQNNETLPDLTTHFRYGSGWGHVQVAGILRRVGYQYRITPADRWSTGYQTGWGINLSSTINTFGDDKLLLQVVYGHGIASYMNDGGMDIAPTANFNAETVTNVKSEAVPLLGVVAYYDHYWSKKWSSSIGYSFTQVDNTNFQDPAAFHKGQYASVNLLSYPVENVMIGGEFLWGKLTWNDGPSGNDSRVQFSVKYNFGTKL